MCIFGLDNLHTRGFVAVAKELDLTLANNVGIDWKV